MHILKWLPVFAVLSAGTAQAGSVSPIVVLELFTSQSCAACLPADAMMKRLTEKDPETLLLSYHVDYWDLPRWKDTYSSKDATARQTVYSQNLKADILTPQLLVDGVFAMTATKKPEVEDAIALAKGSPLELFCSIKPHGDKLAVTLQPLMPGMPDAELLEVRFDRNAKVAVTAGENHGRVVETSNNVTSIKSLGLYKAHSGSEPVIIDGIKNGGVAILVQMPGQKRIVGAVSYTK